MGMSSRNTVSQGTMFAFMPVRLPVAQRRTVSEKQMRDHFSPVDIGPISASACFAKPTSIFLGSAGPPVLDFLGL